MITILENRKTKYMEGVFQTFDDALKHLENNPDEKWELRELKTETLPFFAIFEIDSNSNGLCPPLCVSSQDEVIEYVRNVNLEKFTKHYDDPSDDQIFILDYIERPYTPEDEIPLSHAHIWKHEVQVLKRFISQGQTLDF